MDDTIQTQIENRTDILLDLVAESVVSEVFQLIPANKASDYGLRLILKTESAFSTNRPFRRKILGRRGIEWARSFMRHWLSGMLITDGVPRSAIPEGFKIGLSFNV